MRINPKTNITTWGSLAPGGARGPKIRPVSYMDLYKRRAIAMSRVWGSLRAPGKTNLKVLQAVHFASAKLLKRKKP